MIDSTYNKSKQRRSSFDIDFNTRDDDFVLADLQVIPDDTDLSLVPLSHLEEEEDAIDRLLVNSGFDIELGQVDEKFDEFVIDDSNPLSEFGDFDEFTTQQDDVFVVEPVIEHTLQTGSAVTPPVSDFRIDDFISDYFDKRSDAGDFDQEAVQDLDPAINPVELEVVDDLNLPQHDDETLAVDTPDRQHLQPTTVVTKPVTDFQIDDFISNYFDKRSDVEISDPKAKLGVEEHHLIDQPKPDQVDSVAVQTESSNVLEREADSGDAIADVTNEAAVNAGMNVLNQFKPEQHDINKQLKNRIHATEKSAIITYATLAVAIAALISTIVLGVMVYDMTTEVSKLTGLLEIIKEDMEAHALKTSAVENQSINPSIG